MPNSFQNIENIEDKAPESLKEALVSEIDTMRSSMEVVVLFLPSVFNVIGALFGANEESATDKK